MYTHMYIHICLHTYAHMCVYIFGLLFTQPDIDIYSDKCRIQNGAFL